MTTETRIDNRESFTDPLDTLFRSNFRDAPPEEELTEPPEEGASYKDQDINIYHLYLREVGQYKLLSREEEATLGDCIQTAARARYDPSIPPEELESILARAKKASDKLCEHNQKWVIFIAKKYVGQGMPLPDLIQAGNLGLMRAVEKFDPTKGYKLSTYATWWIRQAIQRALVEEGKTIRIPLQRLGQLRRITVIRSRLVQDLKRRPTSEELAEEVGLSPAEIEDILQTCAQPCSLESPPAGQEDNLKLGDTIPSPVSVEQQVVRSSLHEDIEATIEEVLNSTEKMVIRWRYPSNDDKKRTLEEIGKEFDVTRERIRQIEAEALKKLKRAGRKRHLRDYFE